MRKNVKKCFTPLHPEIPAFQSKDEWHVKVRSSRKPRLLRRGVTGFTFLELLLVITIIAILTGINIPFFKKQIDKQKSSSFANNVYRLLDYAQTYAIAHTKILKVEIKDERIAIKEEGEEAYQEIKSRFSGVDIPELFTLQTDNDEASLLFYPDGTLSPFRWTITYKKERTFIIASTGVNGKITVEKKGATQ